MALTEEKKALPTRDRIPEEYRWRLEDLYSSDAKWQEDYDWVKAQLPRVKAYSGRLDESGATLLEALKERDIVLEHLHRLYAYAHMRKDEDTTRSTYQAMMDRAMSLVVAAESDLAFYQPEILAIPTEKIQQFFAEEKGLELYRHYLDDILRMKPHTLPTEQEALLARMGEIARAPSNIFNMINDADLRFPTIRDEEGDEVEITKGRFQQMLESHDRRVRREAFEAVYETYGRLKNTLAATYNSNLKKDVTFARIRGYSSALEAALYEDNVPVDVYTNLIETVHEHLPLLHRYMSLRKRLLGVDELHMYDLYVPMVEGVEQRLPYDEAIETVRKGLSPLGEEYTSLLGKAFESRWIDVYENKGKRSGAYSSSAYPVHPYVLLNYHPTTHNLFTIAHEMGHAMHTYYTYQTQPYIYANYTIFVAEVASTLNEALLMEHLLETTSDRKARLSLLNHYLEQFRGTVYRQTMFAEFEKKTHEMVEAGQPVTADSLGEIYRELNERYYGPDVVVDPQIELEWSRVPHFYYNFYVYKYATGFAAATALSQKILKEGEPAVERYLDFLRSGASDYSINLLRRAGVDMASPEPIRQSLAVFKHILDEIEQLV